MGDLRTMLREARTVEQRARAIGQMNHDLYAARKITWQVYADNYQIVEMVLRRNGSPAILLGAVMAMLPDGERFSLSVRGDFASSRVTPPMADHVAHHVECSLALAALASIEARELVEAAHG